MITNFKVSTGVGTALTGTNPDFNIPAGLTEVAAVRPGYQASFGFPRALPIADLLISVSAAPVKATATFPVAGTRIKVLMELPTEKTDVTAGVTSTLYGRMPVEVNFTIDADAVGLVELADLSDIAAAFRAVLDHQGNLILNPLDGFKPQVQ